MNAQLDAPEFSDSLQWINCGPQSFDAHRGKVLALVFWHASSAYSENLLRDMQHLQRKHAEGLNLIGVHTPKFEAERNARLVLKAVNRLGLGFPIGLDSDFSLWQQFGVQSWPTVVLIDPAGRVDASFVGDLQRDTIDAAIGGLLERTGLDQRVFAAQPTCAKPEAPLPLAFPSGLAVGSNHLYVADSGHNRILECSLEGRVLRQFGSANPGLVDGIAAECCFRFPRGLFLSRDTLYVADTGNHALRRIRLFDGEVETIAGNGRPGVLDAGRSVPARDATLNAPWSIAGSSDSLYIAMAGAQQVWEFDQSTGGSIRVLAGNGRMALVDGGPRESCFAQPSSLVRVDDTLYVVDAAASAVRTLHLPSQAVHTTIGQGLFEFGDQDGVRSQALLQCPQALVADARKPILWIADSYNNSLRQLRLVGGELKRYELTYRLNEPAALAASSGALWIANSNAHEILRVDLAHDQVRRLPIGE
jgi:hypothetical protein